MMGMKKRLLGMGLGTALVGLGLCGSLWAQSESETTQPTQSAAPVTPSRTGSWTGGGGVGFLAETPDDTAFAVNLFADRFLTEKLSIGPLVQLAFTGDLAQYGFSGQLKYWMGLPDPQSPTKLILQGGAGLVRANFQLDDTSWLIPLGIGIEHTLPSGPSLYAMFLLNFTDLNTGRGTKADVMPGVTFGARF